MNANQDFARDLFERIDKKGPVFVHYQTLMDLWSTMSAVEEWADHWGFTLEDQPVKGGVIVGLRASSFAESVFSREELTEASDDGA